MGWKDQSESIELPKSMCQEVERPHDDVTEKKEPEECQNEQKEKSKSQSKEPRKRAHPLSNTDSSCKRRIVEQPSDEDSESEMKIEENEVLNPFGDEPAGDVRIEDSYAV
ncbi:hypothetical protein GE061_018481 [Apolygus lucorum]|uniref:Uncharacterized protein n=1 Tax=Apolygus lucorum TaxID=248454 RepID=A0A8S9XDV1_APOLU|nr:hypothetical protein GE061_018481 [Apolygus lucorum]